MHGRVAVVMRVLCQWWKLLALALRQWLPAVLASLVPLRLRKRLLRSLELAWLAELRLSLSLAFALALTLISSAESTKILWVR